MIGERYRVVALLGRGGMGEVYRADDLKLGSAVALKFLPQALSSDPEALSRFQREVRVARQISHPNICRVFDLGEAGGLHFLSMEYIDGEDLASLLRRIGRVPQDKAVEIARQLCAGLAAAHDLGVLHRDLKPANIMIDGRGRARITDFGLAGLDTDAGESDFSGTPAYMAPEQFAGKVVTRRSEIYSLGLVLHELFTGRRVFDAKTLEDLRRQRSESSISGVSTLVKEIDPLVDTVIRRCLEDDPEQRPDSALRVAAALPGGDPLQAALAAGETPSPEMVAAAPTRGVLSRRVAGLFLGIGLLLTLVLVFGDRVNLIHRLPLDKSPEVLADRAATLVREASGQPLAAFRACGFDLDQSYLIYDGDPRPAPARWRRLETGQPLTYFFWYRESPQPFAPGDWQGRPYIRFNSPGMTHEGMRSVILDLRGRLVEYRAIPAISDQAATDSVGVAPGTRAADWAPLIRASGLDPARLEATAPRWIPPAHCDVRAAWSGVFADHPDLPLRVEAGSLAAVPVYFRIAAEWDAPPISRVGVEGRDQVAAIVLAMTLLCTLLVAAVVRARAGLISGRSDRAGALRLGVVAAAASALAFVFAGKVSPVPAQVFRLILGGVERGLMVGFTLWLFYLALEPAVRKSRPELLVSWNRIQVGRWRDPMVGRDVLIGTVLGLAVAALLCLAGWIKEWAAIPIPPNRTLDVSLLDGQLGLVALALSKLVESIWAQIGVLLLVAVIQRWVRRERLAAAILWLAMVSLAYLTYARSWPVLTHAIVGAALLIITVTRFGLIAGVAFQLAFSLMICVDPHAKHHRVVRRHDRARHGDPRRAPVLRLRHLDRAHHR
ncbi:MAG: serine/threonine protein kinase [Candidatus Eisenbacteria bacterium]|nr:serine/threonine protein kinase [Candidatus Eisenbacteria bacterium]